MINKYEIKGTKYQIPVLEYCSLKAPKKIVIAVHGICGGKESSTIEAVANALNKCDINVIAFDLPEHGESKAPKFNLTVQNCLEDFRSIESFVRNKYSGIPVSFFSTSFGGYLTLLYLEQTKNNFSEIVLRAPAVNMKDCFERTLKEQNKTISEFKKYPITIGYKRLIDVPYSFYLDLLNNDVYSLYQNKMRRKFTIIHGDKDNIVLKKEITKLISMDSSSFDFISFPNANHLFKNAGEQEKIVEIAVQIFNA